MGVWWETQMLCYEYQLSSIEGLDLDSKALPTTSRRQLLATQVVMTVAVAYCTLQSAIAAIWTRILASILRQLPQTKV